MATELGAITVPHTCILFQWIPSVGLLKSLAWCWLVLLLMVQSPLYPVQEMEPGRLKKLKMHIQWVFNIIDNIKWSYVWESFIYQQFFQPSLLLPSCFSPLLTIREKFVRTTEKQLTVTKNISLNPTTREMACKLHFSFLFDNFPIPDYLMKLPIALLSLNCDTQPALPETDFSLGTWSKTQITRIEPWLLNANVSLHSWIPYSLVLGKGGGVGWEGAL